MNPMEIVPQDTNERLDRLRGYRASAAETPAAEIPAAEISVETPAAEISVETPAAETPAAETPAAETPALLAKPTEPNSAVEFLQQRTQPPLSGMQGPIKPGNLDPMRPIALVKNDDGSISTIRTISIGTDEGEVLIPTVHATGRIMSTDEAAREYLKTGLHFGVFSSPEEADAYGKMLSRTHQNLLANNPEEAKTVMGTVQQAALDTENLDTKLNIAPVAGAMSLGTYEVDQAKELQQLAKAPIDPTWKNPVYFTYGSVVDQITDSQLYSIVMGAGVSTRDQDFVEATMYDIADQLQENPEDQALLDRWLKYGQTLGHILWRQDLVEKMRSEYPNASDDKINDLVRTELNATAENPAMNAYMTAQRTRFIEQAFSRINRASALERASTRHRTDVFKAQDHFSEFIGFDRLILFESGDTGAALGSMAITGGVMGGTFKVAQAFKKFSLAKNIKISAPVGIAAAGAEGAFTDNWFDRKRFEHPGLSPFITMGQIGAGIVSGFVVEDQVDRAIRKSVRWAMRSPVMQHLAPGLLAKQARTGWILHKALNGRATPDELLQLHDELQGNLHALELGDAKLDSLSAAIDAAMANKIADKAGEPIWANAGVQLEDPYVILNRRDSFKTIADDYDKRIREMENALLLPKNTPDVIEELKTTKHESMFAGPRGRTVAYRKYAHHTALVRQNEAKAKGQTIQGLHNLKAERAAKLANAPSEKMVADAERKIAAEKAYYDAMADVHEMVFGKNDINLIKAVDEGTPVLATQLKQIRERALKMPAKTRNARTSLKGPAQFGFLRKIDPDSILMRDTDLLARLLDDPKPITDQEFTELARNIVERDVEATFKAFERDAIPAAAAIAGLDQPHTHLGARVTEEAAKQAELAKRLIAQQNDPALWPRLDPAQHPELMNLIKGWDEAAFGTFGRDLTYFRDIAKTKVLERLTKEADAVKTFGLYSEKNIGPLGKKAHRAGVFTMELTPQQKTLAHITNLYKSPFTAARQVVNPMPRHFISSDMRSVTGIRAALTRLRNTGDKQAYKSIVAELQENPYEGMRRLADILELYTDDASSQAKLLNLDNITTENLRALPYAERRHIDFSKLLRTTDLFDQGPVDTKGMSALMYQDALRYARRNPSAVPDKIKHHLVQAFQPNTVEAHDIAALHDWVKNPDLVNTIDEALRNASETADTRQMAEIVAMRLVEARRDLNATIPAGDLESLLIALEGGMPLKGNQVDTLRQLREDLYYVSGATQLLEAYRTVMNKAGGTAANKGVPTLHQFTAWASNFLFDTNIEFTPEQIQRVYSDLVEQFQELRVANVTGFKAKDVSQEARQKAQDKISAWYRHNVLGITPIHPDKVRYAKTRQSMTATDAVHQHIAQMPIGDETKKQLTDYFERRRAYYQRNGKSAISSINAALDDINKLALNKAEAGFAGLAKKLGMNEADQAEFLRNYFGEDIDADVAAARFKIQEEQIDATIDAADTQRAQSATRREAAVTKAQEDRAAFTRNASPDDVRSIQTMREALAQYGNAAAAKLFNDAVDTVMDPNAGQQELETALATYRELRTDIKRALQKFKEEQLQAFLRVERKPGEVAAEYDKRAATDLEKALDQVIARFDNYAKLLPKDPKTVLAATRQNEIARLKQRAKGNPDLLREIDQMFMSPHNAGFPIGGTLDGRALSNIPREDVDLSVMGSRPTSRVNEYTSEQVFEAAQRMQDIQKGVPGSDIDFNRLQQAMATKNFSGLSQELLDIYKLNEHFQTRLAEKLTQATGVKGDISTLLNHPKVQEILVTDRALQKQAEQLIGTPYETGAINMQAAFIGDLNKKNYLQQALYKSRAARVRDFYRANFAENNPTDILREMYEADPQDAIDTVTQRIEHQLLASNREDLADGLQGRIAITGTDTGLSVDMPPEVREVIGDTWLDDMLIDDPTRGIDDPAQQMHFEKFIDIAHEFLDRAKLDARSLTAGGKEVNAFSLDIVSDQDLIELMSTPSFLSERKWKADIKDRVNLASSPRKSVITGAIAERLQLPTHEFRVTEAQAEALANLHEQTTETLHALTKEMRQRAEITKHITAAKGATSYEAWRAQSASLMDSVIFARHVLLTKAIEETLLDGRVAEDTLKAYQDLNVDLRSVSTTINSLDYALSSLHRHYFETMQRPPVVSGLDGPKFDAPEPDANLLRAPNIPVSVLGSGSRADRQIKVNTAMRELGDLQGIELANIEHMLAQFESGDPRDAFPTLRVLADQYAERLKVNRAARTKAEVEAERAARLNEGQVAPIMEEYSE